MRDITEQIQESKEAADAIVPGSGRRTWKLEVTDGSGQLVEREYCQEELGFFPKQEFINLLTDEADKFIRGEYGVKISEFFKGNALRQLKPPDLSGANDGERAAAVEETISNNIEIINGFFHIVRILPGLQKDIIALALGVKKIERSFFKDAISEPPSRGGLTDEQGFEIMKIFVRQNAKAIRAFFEERAAELVEDIRVYVLGEERSSTSEDSTTTENGQEPSTPTPSPTTAAAPDPSPGGTPLSTSSPATLASA